PGPASPCRSHTDFASPFLVCLRSAAVARRAEINRIRLPWISPDDDQQPSKWILAKTSAPTLHPHRDMSGNLPFGRLRFHVPNVTNPEVEFVVCGNRLYRCHGQPWL